MKVTGSLISLIVILFVASCSQKASESSEEAQLGTIEMQVSGAEEAKPYFEQGLLLLHSFEYPDSREAFRQAQEIDDNFAMAYWGEAMSYNLALWRSQNYEKGKAALKGLGETKEVRMNKAESELEKDFIESVEILYGDGSKFERDQAYKDHLAKMYEKYPNNNEVAAFYALSLLGSVEVGRDDEVYGKSAVIAEGILKENPNHPGALHYLIHSYDDPYHAYKAIQAADSYSQVAPDASHALHMPSHIYVAIGMWDEVVASNIDSYNASVNRMLAKELDNDARSYHALHWLLYGYLQKDNQEEPQKIVSNMETYMKELPSRRARSYMVSIKGAFLVERNAWGGEFADIDVDCSDMNITIRGMDYFIDGRNAYERGEKESLETTIAKLEKERKEAEIKAFNDGVPVCSVGGYAADNPNKLDVDKAYIMEMELKALNALMEDNSEEAEEWMKKASLLEESISYSYGPPDVLKPTHEMYGEWLLEQNRYEEALSMFEKSLERAPKRRLSLEGKLNAAENLGKDEIVDETMKELDQFTDKELIVSQTS